MENLNMRSAYEVLYSLINKNENDMYDLMNYMDEHDTIDGDKIAEDLKKLERIKYRSLDILKVIDTLDDSSKRVNKPVEKSEVIGGEVEQINMW